MRRASERRVRVTRSRVRQLQPRLTAAAVLNASAPLMCSGKRERERVREPRHACLSGLGDYCAAATAALTRSQLFIIIFFSYVYVALEDLFFFSLAFFFYICGSAIRGSFF